MRKQKRPESRHKRHAKDKHTGEENVAGNKGTEFLPYKTQESKVLGRYLVSTRDLRPGEIIMSDEPLVVGPCQEAKPLCIGCYIDIDLRNPQTYHRCNDCGWPLCASTCSGYHKQHGHSEGECELISKSKIKEIQPLSFVDFYYAIMPLRCLTMKQKSPENWEIFKSMECHTEERRKSRELWETNQKLAVDVIRNIWGLTEFSEEEIHFVCGVLEVNAFEINLKSPSTKCLRGVYSKAFLFAHDCTPNTRRSNGPDFQLIIRAMRSISKNEIITVGYAYTLQCTLMRRKHLQETKFFSCTCKRCSDPTEFDTYTGAMICFTCKTGFLLPENPLDANSKWKCTSPKCPNQMEVSQIIPLLNSLFKELDSIGGNDVSGYEKFVEKCCRIFHENHYLSLSAMHCLSQLYGKIDGFLINDLTREQLERKEEICRKLIRIFDKLEPGMSKQRGILLYELQAPLMVLLRRRFQTLPKKELKSKIKEILKYLDEAFVILSTEPEDTTEGQMAIAAKEARGSLQDWLNVLN